MRLVGRMSLRAQMDDAFKADGCATEMMIVAMDPTRLNVHQQNVIRSSSSSVTKNIVSQQSGDVMANSTAPMVPTRRWVWLLWDTNSQHEIFSVNNAKLLFSNEICIHFEFVLSQKHKSNLCFPSYQTSWVSSRNKRSRKICFALLLSRSNEISEIIFCLPSGVKENFVSFTKCFKKLFEKSLGKYFLFSVREPKIQLSFMFQGGCFRLN